MELYRISLELARNPGHPDEHVHGYFLVAPLDGNNKIDVAAWREHRDDCIVSRFEQADTIVSRGHLTHRGDHWRFHYEEKEPRPDEEGYRLGDHAFEEGAYVTIDDAEEGALVYKVTDVTPLKDF